MNINRTLRKRILIVVCCILVSILGIASPVVHRLTDYRIAAELLTPSDIPFSKPEHQLPLSQIKHVFVIVEENHDWSKIYKNPEASFMNKTLLVQGAYASQYYNVPKNLHALHPSEPNYILMETGKIAFSDHTFTTDDPPSEKNSTSTKNYFVKLLEKNGLTWKSYQEDIPGTNCPVKNINRYVTKHNPYVFFQDITGHPLSETNSYCRDHNRPFSALLANLNSGHVPNYSFITPNVQHEMHDGTIAQADTWLSQVVPLITRSQTFQQDGALFITWDEGSAVNNDNVPIGMMMLSPFIKPGFTNNIAYSHFSYLKTIQEIFNVSPLLGGAADPSTRDLADFFQTNRH